ncbi:MAG TPA: hypothetical protein VLK26_12220 [Rudaea sp.]|nr:hypothetical protein [Rudaea sp.]
MTIPISGVRDTAQAVAIDPDGNIVLAGSAGGNYSALARVTPAGTLDGAFGTLGVATPDFSSSTGGDGQRAFLRMDDGRYVGCGHFNSPTTGNDFVVARFQSNGALDPAFNGAGYAVTPFTSTASQEQCNAVALQNDGMIVSAGYSTNGSGHLHVALTRHTAGGVLDTLFGGPSAGGKVDIDASANLNGDSEARALLLQADGKLLIAGYALGAASDDFLVMRLKTDGTLDPTFGTAGITRTPIGTSEDIANAMILQPDGGIVLAGSVYAADGHRDFALARYTTNGVLDPTFGSGGKVTTPVGPSDDYAYALLRMPWGRLVAAGSARISTGGSGTDVAVVAYNADGSLDRYFGIGGKRMLNISTLDDIAYGLAYDASGDRFWAVGTAASGASPNQDFLAVEFGLPDTIFRHGFDTATAP